MRREPPWSVRVRVHALVALVVVAVAVFAPAVAAEAHVNALSSQPTDGAIVGTAPTTVTVRFSERVDPALAELTLSARGGTPARLADPRQGGSDREVVADLPPLDKGVYAVTYRVRDPIDLHLTAGSIVFGVGTSEALVPAGARVGAPRLLDLVVRQAERLALAVLMGGVVVAVLLAPRVGGSAGSRAARTLAERGLGVARAGALGLLVTAPLQVAIEAADIGPPWVDTVKTVVGVSAFGRRVLVLAVLAGGVAALAGIVRRGLSDDVLGRWRRGRLDELGAGLLVLAVGTCVVVSIGGHAGTGGSFAAGVALRVVHLGAMGAWAGAMFVLVLVLRPVTTGDRNTEARPTVDVADRAVAWRAFSSVAGPAFAALIVTGLLLSGRGLATVTALFTTWYGRLLLAKLVALAGAAVLGARHARSVRRGATPAGRGLVFEAALALLVVVGGASLTASPPGLGPRFDKAAAPTPPPVAQQLGDVTVKLSMRPNRPGPNLVTATVVSTRRPAPGPITGVRLALVPIGDGVPVTASAGAPVDGTVDFGTIELSQSGQLRADIAVDRPAAAVPAAQFAWYVDPVPVPRAPTVVSDARVAPVANALAAFAAAAFALAAWFGRGRRAR